jgi:hypothetical protein
MRAVGVSVMISAAVLAAAVSVADAGGRSGGGRGGALRAPSAAPPGSRQSPFGHHRFPRHLPFGGIANDVEVVEIVREVPAGSPVAVKDVAPPTPVAEPKFVLPPEPAVTGSETVVIQRGSRIELHTFGPTSRQP